MAKSYRLNQVDTILVDTGYFSPKITPLIAVKRDAQHSAWRECFTEPAPLAGNASPVDTGIAARMVLGRGNEADGAAAAPVSG